MDTKKHLKRVAVLLAMLVVLYFLFSGLNKAILPPSTFPVPYRVTINSGQTLFSISKELSTDGVIKSRRVFEMLVMTFGDESHISEGEYYFEKPVSVVEVAMRIAGRNFGIDRKKVTFPEGFSNLEMANRLENTFDSFDKELFLSLTKEQEGYLFPDTYGFFPSTPTDVIVTTLKKNFEKKTADVKIEAEKKSQPFADIIVMASIIEKEANGDEDRELISGILWNRIKAGIALQVDAPFLYLLNKESSKLTKTDLAINSPFNTYKYKGLPPSPINNPGLASIEAALNPKPSEYFYYLHDKNGNIHYAKTYTEHKKNISLYLK